jgi:hypothetical protein
MLSISLSNKLGTGDEKQSGRRIRDRYAEMVVLSK